MIDISKIKYKVFLLMGNGEQVNLTDIAQNLNWEENEGELALKISVSLANVIYNGKRISSIAKPNCYIIVNAEIEGVSTEVARGKIIEWEPSKTGDSNNLSLNCCDELFDLQASQDNRYIKSGTSAKTALLAIFKDWGIRVGSYHGTTVKLPKLIYKCKSLAEIILDILDIARRRCGKKSIVRAVKGKIHIIAQGSNYPIYCFEESLNVLSTKYKMSAASIVTVVKIVGKAEDDERQPVEAIVKGEMKYGKRQIIQTRDEDDSLAAATKTAKAILKEQGKPAITFSIKTPDVPFIRKGDKVKLKTGIYSGYAIVAAIQHEANNRTMTMTLDISD